MSNAEEIWQLARDLMRDPEQWMNTPNPAYGGDCPKDWIGTKKEQILKEDLLRILHGIPS